MGKGNIKQSSLNTNNNHTILGRKGIKQSKRQTHSDISAISQMKNKNFRVYYSLINCSKSKKEESLQIAAQIITRDTSLTGDLSQLSEIKEWFCSLTVEERINACCTTSPYLSEVLINMQRQCSRKGQTMFAMQGKSGGFNRFQSLSEQMFKRTPQDDLFNQFAYGSSYYLGANTVYQNTLKQYNNELLYSLRQDENQDKQAQDLRSEDMFPIYFEDIFYCRVRHYTEIQQLQKTEPIKYQALLKIADELRFCDQFKYIDSVTISFTLARDPNAFFEMLASISNGQAFAKRCQFQFDQKLGIHQIEPPNWFQPERFQCFGTWIAAVFEENMWAHFNYHKSKQSGNQELEYLFDIQNLQDTCECPSVNIDVLATAWQNASCQKKQEVTDQLQTRLKERQKEKSEKFLRCEYFLVDFHYEEVILEQDVIAIISHSSKLGSGSKHQYAVDFIIDLILSSSSQIEKSKDIINRTFLKLVQQMYQDQVISELIEEPITSSLASKPIKKKRNKNKVKQIKDTENIDNQNNNKTQLKNMNDLHLSNTSLSVQQISLITPQNTTSPIKQEEEDSQESERSQNEYLEQLRLSASPLRDNSVDVGNNYKAMASALKLDPSEQIEIESDMRKLSQEYVSDMLTKIEAESNLQQATQATEPEKQQKSAKKRKPKNQNIQSPSKSESEEVKTSDKTETKVPKKNELQSQLVVLDSQIVAEEVSPKQSKAAKKRSTNITIEPTNKPKKQNEIQLQISKTMSAQPETLSALIKPPVEATADDQSQNPEDSENKGGRRRNRKNKKGALDPQQAMNQFIQQFNNKKEDKNIRTKQAPKPSENTRGGSRQNSQVQSQKASSYISDKKKEEPVKKPNIPPNNKSSAKPPIQAQVQQQSVPKQAKDQQKKVRNSEFDDLRDSETGDDKQLKYQEKSQTETLSLADSEKQQMPSSPPRISTDQKKHSSAVFVPNNLRLSFQALKDSKISANSPSFKPSLPKNNLGLMMEKEVLSPDPVEIEKQNSLINMVRDLKQVRSFNPTNVSSKFKQYDETELQSQDQRNIGNRRPGQFGSEDNQMRYQAFTPKQPWQYQQVATKPQMINLSDQLSGILSQVQEEQSRSQQYQPNQQMPIPSINYQEIQKYSQGIQDMITRKDNSSGSNTSQDSDQARQHNMGTVSGQIGQINQTNSFNINIFGNLNITGGSQPNHFQNFGPVMSGFQNMSMSGSNIQYPPVQQQQMQYQQYYDYNMPQNIEYKFYEKFDNDIYDEVNRIQQQLDLTKVERGIVLQKLQQMCEQAFMNPNQDTNAGSPKKVFVDNQTQCPKIQQFGSLITGLALESSDMDMAVTNLVLPDREKMIDCLDLFAEKIKEWEMIQDLNAISTASIPVIKATVDLNKIRSSNVKKSQEAHQHNDFGSTQADLVKAKPECPKDNQRIPDELSKLKIDITFDDNLNVDNNSLKQNQLFDANMPKTHQGLASCKLIKNYVEHYKCLKEVSIILKQFLSRMELNSPYHGGLSSYSTVLLLVAYMNKWNLKMSATLTPSRLLMGFLDYYSYYFNVSLFGIDVSNNGSFYELSSPESNFVILDPLNCMNNTTRMSFLTHEIIKSFRKAFNSLKNLLLHYQQLQNANITDNLVDLILQREKQQTPEYKQQD